MDKYTRHQKTWTILYKLLHRYVEHKFNMKHEDCNIEGPCIIIPNHVTTWDPLLVAMSFPKKQMYFVASEHLFRKGFISKLLYWLVEPIARKKASVGTDTAMACLRHLHAGHSICIFAEGDSTWDGYSNGIFPSTGKMVRSSKATLITYKIEGGYLSLPRWRKHLNRGKMFCHPVGIYPPEVLKTMTAEEITDLINRDIYEDTWERQKNEPVKYTGKKRTDGIETALFLCPKCGGIGTLKGGGTKVTCTCGFTVEMTEYGEFSPSTPFENIAQWDVWQHQQLKSPAFTHGDLLFSDNNIILKEIQAGHSDTVLASGRLDQQQNTISCGGVSFDMDKILNMAMVQTNVLLFSYEKKYYEIHSDSQCSLRKYLAVWDNLQQKVEVRR